MRNGGRITTVGRPARKALVTTRAAKPPQLYQARPRGPVKNVYLGGPGDSLRGSRLKWFVSTCLAAAVGVGAIGIVLLSNMEPSDVQRTASSAVQRSVWQRIWDLDKLKPAFTPSKKPATGVQIASGKGDRLEVAAGGMITRHVIHDSVRQRRSGREFIQIKPYARIVARLSNAPPPHNAQIPPFNPFRLYANLQPVSSAGDSANAPGERSDTDSDVAIKVVELLGGFLPEEDGQELGSEEVAGLVARSGLSSGETPEMRTAYQPEGTGDTGQGTAGSDRSATAEAKPVEPLPPNTTVITRSVLDGEDDDVEGRETRIVRVTQGLTLMNILRSVGAEVWQARAIVDMANTTFPVAELKQGHEVRLTLDPSPTSEAKVVPVKVSIYGEGHRHYVTVGRNAAGEYVLGGNDVEAEIAQASRGKDQQAPATLYTSLYHAALLQNVPADVIELILRTNAYDVDFKRRVRPGDGFELFFDVRNGDQGGEGELGELLFTSLTVGGDTKRFFRFRTPDGAVEYYDEDGNNSKKFLMRRPVRSEAARLTDGFGMRFHPLFRVRRMHTGIDWAAPAGTPIMAAGGGVIEEAGRKGGYGNYVRIRHANGYKTTYGHMLKLAPGVVPDAKVAQGQIIGYVGSTGSSTGNHLHFEILVNNSFVDPMRINVPRERRLTGKERVAFKKERERIEDLMHRGPVSTRVYTDRPDDVPAAAAHISTSSVLKTAADRKPR